MSDLVKEAAPLLSPTTDSSNQAVNKRKLLAISSRGTAAGGFSGDQASLVVDAFAEVFASMAIASPPPIENSGGGDKDAKASDEVIESPKHSDETDQDDTRQTVADDTVIRSQDTDSTEFAVQAQVARNIDVENVSENEPVHNGNLEASGELAEVEAEIESVEASQLAVVAGISQSSDDVEPGVQLERSSKKSNESIDAKPGISAVDTEAAKPTARSIENTETNQADTGDLQSSDQTGENAGEQSESQDRRRYSKNDGSASERPLTGTPGQSSSATTKSTTTAVTQQSEAPLSQTVGSPVTSTSDRPVVSTSSVTASAAAASTAAIAAVSSTSGAALQGSVSNSGIAASQTSADGARSLTGTEHSGRPEWASNSKSSKKPDASVSQTDTLTRIKLVQRVSRAFQHLGPEGGVVRLRLAPAELGTVRVEMQIQQKKVNARIVAETEAASGALREHLPELRARLEAHGMQIESLDIETQSGDSDASGLDRRSQKDHGGQHHANSERQSRSDRAGRRETSDNDRAISAPVSRHPLSLASSGGVDIRF